MKDLRFFKQELVMTEPKSVKDDSAEEITTRCSICAKKSISVICEHCEAVIRGEALDHKIEAEKKGKK